MVKAKKSKVQEVVYTELPSATLVKREVVEHNVVSEIQLSASGRTGEEVVALMQFLNILRIESTHKSIKVQRDNGIIDEVKEEPRSKIKYKNDCTG